jgi:hypothetical protein
MTAPRMDDLYGALTAGGEQDDTIDPLELKRRGMGALYGSGFPLIRAIDAGAPPTEADWVRWPQQLWGSLRSGVQKRLHKVERNRLFRDGEQWITSIGMGPWAPPPKPKTAARMVVNMIAPALDQRLQVITEQRPGFRTKPATLDPDAAKRAEAQQLALEYQHDQQDMGSVIREAAYWAGTDGVSFLCSYWEPDRGPWSEVEIDPGANESLGTEVDAEGNPMTQAPPTAEVQMGDICTKVYRIEQVRVSPNATATEEPFYWIIREAVPLSQSVFQRGEKVVSNGAAVGAGGDLSDVTTVGRYAHDSPSVDELHLDQETVDRFTVFCERSEYLPKGLTLIVEGDRLIFVGPLLAGVVPIVRLTDGSSDPAFYPKAIMENWLEAQQRVNAITSKWVESIRTNAGGRFLSRAGMVTTETLIGGTLSMIEVKGAGALGDIIQPVNGFSVGTDAKELLALEVKRFEDLSGWNDVSRGSFEGDSSGRAILATRETLERVFAPPVGAVAKAMTKWAKIQLHWMKWGYDLPRTIALVGQSRPDLGMQVTSEDFNGIAEVEIDPETLMPMPRALRLFLLDQLRDAGEITPAQHLKRMPFGSLRNIDSPDDDHNARARRVAEAIKRGAPPPPIRWQDNEAIHQDVLEREIILNDTLPEPIIQLASQRWIELANQASMKAGLMAPPAPTPASGQQSGSGATGVGPGQTPSGLPPDQQPTLGSNPAVSAAPLALNAGSDEEAAGAQFDRMSPV